MSSMLKSKTELLMKMGSALPGRVSDSQEAEVLTKREKDVICGCWKELLKRRAEFFTVVWISALERDTTIKDMFVLKQGQDPKENEHFISLTISVEFFFRRLVECGLDNDRVRQVSEDLGRKHRHYTGNGFQLSHWHVFMSCLISSMKDSTDYLDMKTRGQLVDAWSKLVRSVICHMQVGFDRTERELKHMAD